MVEPRVMATTRGTKASSFCAMVTRIVTGSPRCRRILQEDDDVADFGGFGLRLADAAGRVDAGGNGARGGQDEPDLPLDAAVRGLPAGLSYGQPHECAHECLHHGDAKKHTIAQRCN